MKTTFMKKQMFVSTACKIIGVLLILIPSEEFTSRTSHAGYWGWILLSVIPFPTILITLLKNRDESLILLCLLSGMFAGISVACFGLTLLGWHVAIQCAPFIALGLQFLLCGFWRRIIRPIPPQRTA